MRGSGIVEGSLPRENAVIVVLCREWELDNITETIKTLERQFNHRLNSGFFIGRRSCKMYHFFAMRFGTDSVSLSGSSGWVISIPEFMQAIPTLYSTILRFMEEHPQFIHPKSIFNKFMLTDQQGDADMCNGCHFLFNFEIGSLNFWRSEAYMTFFDYLDKASGFYYERWGDASVHSIALALVTEESQLHFFLTSLATIMR
ncbi:hypothetical protein BGZ52_009965 [Haplosporangium bisporale]|nr:hypothetical protein BGZ52_009965 [Haplosporangium bisporale]